MNPNEILSGNNVHVALMIAIMALVTLLLRALPFIVFNGSKPTPRFIVYLSDVLPYAIIGMLVIYCLKDIRFAGSTHGIPEIVSVAVVAALHFWKKNTLLSIVAGTVLYMALIQNWDAIVSFVGQWFG